MDANGSRAYVPYHVTENSMNIVPNLCHEYITLAEVEVVHLTICSNHCHFMLSYGEEESLVQGSIDYAK